MGEWHEKGELPGAKEPETESRPTTSPSVLIISVDIVFIARFFQPKN